MKGKNCILSNLHISNILHNKNIGRSNFFTKRFFYKLSLL